MRVLSKAYCVEIRCEAVILAVWRLSYERDGHGVQLVGFMVLNRYFFPGSTDERSP